MQTKLPGNYVETLAKLVRKSHSQINFDEKNSIQKMSEYLDANGNNILDILLDKATSLELKESATASEEKEFRNKLFLYSNAFSLIANRSPELLNKTTSNGQNILGKLFQNFNQLQNSNQKSAKIIQDYLYFGSLQKLVGSGYDISSALELPEFANTLQQMMQNDNYYTALVTSTIVGAMPKSADLSNKIKQLYSLKYGKEAVKDFDINQHITSLEYEMEGKKYNVLECIANGFFCFPKYIDQTNRIKPLTHLLIKEYNVNLADKVGKTSLMFAIENGNIELINELLIQAPELLNQYDTLHQTPLMIAVNTRNAKIVEILVNAGANLDIKDYLGKTALEHATASNFKEIEGIIKDRILLEKIGREVGQGNAKSVLQLLEKHDNPNFKDSFGKTAFMHAVENNRLNLVKRWMKKGEIDINAQDNNGASALLYSILSGDKKLIQTLLKAGAKPNIQDNMMATPIMIAAVRGDIESVKLLIQNNALVTYKDSGDRTLLMYAAKGDNLDTFLYILDNYFSINEVDKEGKTALMYAVSGNLDSAVKTLINKSTTDIHAQDNDGKTVLMLAAKAGKLDIVQLLIEKGVDIHAQDKDGKTALFHAAEGGYTETVKVLRQNGVEVDLKDKNNFTTLMHAAQNGDIGLMNAIIKSVSKNLDIRNNLDGKTALMYAVSDNLDLPAKTLINKSTADLNLKDNNGATALILAVKAGKLKITQLLIEKGADIHAQDKDGMSAAKYAILYGNMDIAKSLIKNGVDIEELGFLEDSYKTQEKTDNNAKHSEQKNNYTELNIYLSAQSKTNDLMEQHDVISTVITGISLYVNAVCKIAENVISQVNRLVDKVGKSLRNNQYIQNATSNKRSSFVEKLEKERASRSNDIER